MSITAKKREFVLTVSTEQSKDGDLFTVNVHDPRSHYSIKYGFNGNEKWDLLLKAKAWVRENTRGEVKREYVLDVTHPECSCGSGFIVTKVDVYDRTKNLLYTHTEGQSLRDTVIEEAIAYVEENLIDKTDDRKEYYLDGSCGNVKTIDGKEQLLTCMDIYDTTDTRVYTVTAADVREEIAIEKAIAFVEKVLNGRVIGD